MKQLFMGCGDKSMAEVGRLYRQLGQAIDILNGIQQPPPCTAPEGSFKAWEQEVEDGEFNLQIIARDIYGALTGKEPKLLHKDE